MSRCPFAQFESLESDDPAKWNLAAQFAQSVGAQFLQGHQIVQNRTDDEIEMRGVWHGYQVRMKVDMSFGGVEWDMQGQNPTGQDLYLFWDNDAIPNVGQFNAEFAGAWDDDSEEKVFFARGMYMEVDAQAMARALAVYSALPEAVRTSVANFMVSDKIAKLYAYANGKLWLDLGTPLHELTDPINQAGRGVWLIGQMTWGLSQVNASAMPPVLAPNAPAYQGVATHRMICRYCSSHFLLEQSPSCPNCGAPPR
jgi:hypothetical protein